MIENNEFSGGCLCGDIRFVATGHPIEPHACSCEQCQKHSGSLTLCWLEFKKNNITWTGKGGIPSTFRSSAYSARAFCPNCGSSLGAIDDGDSIGLLLGAFDNKALNCLKPLYHSFEDAQPSWWCINIKL